MLFRTASPKMTSFNSHSPSLPTTCANDDSSPSLPRPLKRRLSEFGSDEPAVKKSRGSDWAPRKQTVSDPLPLHTQSFDWESWCTEAFALPPSVTTSHPVPDALDFELFNFEVFPTSQSTGQFRFNCAFLWQRFNNLFRYHSLVYRCASRIP